MKNVIVVALAGGRYAIELRWVREVFPLVHLTPIPTAPPEIAGAVNFRGAIVPVLSARVLLGQGRPRPPRPGDTMVLLDVDDVRAALAVDRVDAVTTLAGEPLETPSGEPVTLLDPPALVQAAMRSVDREHGG